MLIVLSWVQNAKDALPELSDRPKLPPPLVAPPNPLLPSLWAATVAEGFAAGEGRPLLEDDAAAGCAVVAALPGSGSTATALQVHIVIKAVHRAGP